MIVYRIKKQKPAGSASTQIGTNCVDIVRVSYYAGKPNIKQKYIVKHILAKRGDSVETYL